MFELSEPSKCLSVNEGKLETCLTCFGALSGVFVCLVDQFPYLDVVNLFFSLE